MNKPLITAAVETEAHFHDVDIMRVVWHGNYARYLELGRVAILDKIDYGYDAMQASGYAWPVIEMNIRYAHPITLRQRIVINTSLVEWENRLKLNYTITDKMTGKRLSKAHCTHVAVDIRTGEMMWETPLVFRQKLESFLS